MWRFVDRTPVIPISIRNPLLEQIYPESKDGTILAVLDTGYSGFLYVPTHIFRKLGFHKLKNKSVSATLADGSTLKLTASYGSICIPSLQNLTVEGMVETSKNAEEILIGMGGIRNLLLELDCCRETLNAENCSSS